MKPQDKAQKSTKPQDKAPKSALTLTRIALLGAAIILLTSIAYNYYQERNSQSTVVDSPAGQAAAQQTGSQSTAQTKPTMPNGATMARKSAEVAPAVTLPEQLMKANISLLDGRKKRL